MSAATFFDVGVGAAVPARRDWDIVKSRTRRTMTISMCAHLLLMMWLVVLKPATEQKPEFTEITLLEPGDLTSAPARAAAPAAGPEVKGMPRSSAKEVRFTRARTDADIAPEPQSVTAVSDRIAARLASIQSNAPVSVSGVASAGLPTGVLGAAASAPNSLGSGGGTVALTRGGSGTGSGPALNLTRGGTGNGVGPAVVSTGLPSEGSAAAAPARGGESSARRSLAGALLMGPVADRPVIQYTKPLYPEWAKRDAVEGSVTLYFVVRPDGSIKENVLVQKTAGFEEFDDNARTALRAWRFQPLSGGRTGEQWGTITFHFRLREAG
jgi:TonB family protein